MLRGGKKKELKEGKAPLQEWAERTRLKYLQLPDDEYDAYAVLFVVGEEKDAVPVVVGYNNKNMDWIAVRAIIAQDTPMSYNLLEELNEFNDGTCGTKVVYNKLARSVDAIYEIPAKLATAEVIDFMIVDAAMTAARSRKIVEASCEPSPEFV